MALTPYMLHRQSLKNGTKVAEVKPVKPLVRNQKPIPKVGEKEKKVKARLKKAYPAYLEEHPICNIQSRVCSYAATCVNHTRGRGANVENQDDWEASCVPCNGYIEEHHAEYAKLGHKKSRHSIK